MFSLLGQEYDVSEIFGVRQTGIEFLIQLMSRLLGLVETENGKEDANAIAGAGLAGLLGGPLLALINGLSARWIVDQLFAPIVASINDVINRLEDEEAQIIGADKRGDHSFDNMSVVVWSNTGKASSPFDSVNWGQHKQVSRRTIFQILSGNGLSDAQTGSRQV